MSSSAIRIRNPRGEFVEPAAISSSDAKNGFGRVLEQVTKEGGVAITLRNEPRFMVIPIETYQRMAQADSRLLDTLTGEFDALLDRMQQPGARAAMERAFGMAPDELGKAARRQVAAVARMPKPAAAGHVAPVKRSAARKTRHRTRG
jgi:prevent-host-death family protein